MKDYLNFTGSCNDVLEAGIRYIYGAYATDSPYSGVNGLLVTFKSSFKTLNSDYVSQAFYANPSGVFGRFNPTGKSDGWQPWRRLDNFGYNSLAELSAGVAGFTSNIGNKLNGTKITDLDTLRTAGIYTFSSASDITVGLPPISDKSLMMLVTVTSYTGTANTLEYMQTAICGGVTYCREFYGNSWKDWKNLSNFGYNSLDELSAGVAKNDPTRIKSIQGKRLVKIGACKKWSQGSFIASVANASGYHCGVLGISYRHMDSSQNVSYSFSGAEPVGIEIYKKLNNEVLEVYIYSTQAKIQSILC